MPVRVPETFHARLPVSVKSHNSPKQKFFLAASRYRSIPPRARKFLWYQQLCFNIWFSILAMSQAGAGGEDLRLKRDDRRISLTLTISTPSLFGKENLASIVFGGVI